VKTVVVILAVAAALVVQSTLSGMLIGRTMPVNLVIVAVVYVALAFGAATGMLAGALGGLVQDALAGGVVGVGGLSKTVIGFFVGVLGAQFIMSGAVARFLMFAGATLVHEVLFGALRALVDGSGFALRWPSVLVQALVNAVIGVLAFWVVERGPEMWTRRRMRRGAGFSKRRF
jgi:rod shape-determining protein MreD